MRHLPKSVRSADGRMRLQGGPSGLSEVPDGPEGPVYNQAAREYLLVN
jgi:hypothetical protein